MSSPSSSSSSDVLVSDGGPSPSSSILLDGDAADSDASSTSDPISAATAQNDAVVDDAINATDALTLDEYVHHFSGVVRVRYGNCAGPIAACSLVASYLFVFCREQTSPVMRWQQIEAAFEAAGRTSLGDTFNAVCVHDSISYHHHRCIYSIRKGQATTLVEGSDQLCANLWSRHNHQVVGEHDRPHKLYAPQTNLSSQIAAELQPTIQGQTDRFHSYVATTIQQTDAEFSYRTLAPPAAPTSHGAESYKCFFTQECAGKHEPVDCPGYRRDQRQCSQIISCTDIKMKPQAVGAMIWINIDDDIFVLHAIKIQSPHIVYPAESSDVTFGHTYYRCGGRVEKDNEDPLRRIATEILEEVFCVVHSSQFRPNQRMVTDHEHRRMMDAVISCLGKDAAYLTANATVDGKQTIYFSVSYLELVRALGLQARLTAASRMPFIDKFQSLDNEHIQCLAWVPLPLLMGGGSVPSRTKHASLVNVNELLSRTPHLAPNLVDVAPLADTDLRPLFCPGKDYDAIQRLCEDKRTIGSLQAFLTHNPTVAAHRAAQAMVKIANQPSTDEDGFTVAPRRKKDKKSLSPR